MIVPRLSAGVITADLTRLGAELEVLRGVAAWAHVDVMDGVFCPQLTVGPAFVAAVASTGIPVDAHLMVEEPRRLLPDIATAGASVITVHAEATRHLHRTMQEMTELAGGPRPFLRGVAINPGTPVQAVEPVLGLADLVLLLAVDPGWPGQRPTPGSTRPRAGRQLRRRRPGGRGRRCHRRQRRRDRRLGPRCDRQRQRDFRRPQPGPQPRGADPGIAASRGLPDRGGSTWQAVTAGGSCRL